MSDQQIAFSIGLMIISGLSSVLVTLLVQNRQERNHREEGKDRDFGRTRDRVTDKQATQGELMAGVVARIGQLETGHHKLEDGYEKVADALDRLTRLEEFRVHADPKLKEAEETARTVIAFGEQMKSVLRRIDVMTEQMNKQMNEMPRAIASELRSLVRVVPSSGAGRQNG